MHGSANISQDRLCYDDYGNYCAIDEHNPGCIDRYVSKGPRHSMLDCIYANLFSTKSNIGLEAAVYTISQ